MYINKLCTKVQTSTEMLSLKRLCYKYLCTPSFPSLNKVLSHHKIRFVCCFPFLCCVVPLAVPHINVNAVATLYKRCRVLLRFSPTRTSQLQAKDKWRFVCFLMSAQNERKLKVLDNEKETIYLLAEYLIFLVKLF